MAETEDVAKEQPADRLPVQVKDASAENTADANATDKMASADVVGSKAVSDNAEANFTTDVDAVLADLTSSIADESSARTDAVTDIDSKNANHQAQGDVGNLTHAAEASRDEEQQASSEEEQKAGPEEEQPASNEEEKPEAGQEEEQEADSVLEALVTDVADTEQAQISTGETAACLQTLCMGSSAGLHLFLKQSFCLECCSMPLDAVWCLKQNHNFWTLIILVIRLERPRRLNVQLNASGNSKTYA